MILWNVWSPAVAFFTNYHNSGIRTCPPPPRKSILLTLAIPNIYLTQHRTGILSSDSSPVLRSAQISLRGWDWLENTLIVVRHDDHIHFQKALWWCVVFLVSSRLALSRISLAALEALMSLLVYFFPHPFNVSGSWICSKWKLQKQHQTSIMTLSYKITDFAFRTCSHLPKMVISPNIYLDYCRMQKFWRPINLFHLFSTILLI